jgi:hypothetical protein
VCVAPAAAEEGKNRDKYGWPQFYLPMPMAGLTRRTMRARGSHCLSIVQIADSTQSTVARGRHLIRVVERPTGIVSHSAPVTWGPTADRRHSHGCTQEEAQRHPHVPIHITSSVPSFDEAPPRTCPSAGEKHAGGARICDPFAEAWRISPVDYSGTSPITAAFEKPLHLRVK